MTQRPKATGAARREFLDAYRQGARYLRDREHAGGLGQRRPRIVEPLPGGRRCLFSKDPVGKQIARRLADKLAVDEKTIQSNAKFAEAVELIAKNCGITAPQLLSLAGHSSHRMAIMELSRTSDERQRYRVEGVIAGRFKSLKIAGDDPVFDTVTFSEIPSRLRRARGAILACLRSLDSSVPEVAVAECGVLAKICCDAAQRLQRFVSASSRKAVIVPKRLTREHVQPILSRRSVRGMIVGGARLALKLTIKNVWDFPEMQLRGILADQEQCEQTLQELAMIIEASRAIWETAFENQRGGT